MTDENPHAGQGAVMLDIGGDIGALVVLMPPAMEGLEVEIRPIGGPANDRQQPHDPAMAEHGHGHGHGHGPGHPHLLHVAVVARPVADGVAHSLVFPELTDGTYELYERPAGPVELTVTVRGGEVTTAGWPAVTA